MSNDPTSPTPPDPSPSGSRVSNEIALIVAALALLFGAPMLVGRLYGIGPVKGLLLSFAPIHGGVPVTLVWLVGGILLFRRWKKERSVSPWGLVAIGGCLAITLGRSLFHLWLYHSGWASKGGSLIWIGEIAPSVLMAVCWALLIAALLGGRHGADEGRQVDSTTPDGPPKSSRFGALVLCTTLGAGLGFFLHVFSDVLNDSPYRSVIYVVGGCLLGVMIALGMDLVATRRPR